MGFDTPAFARRLEAAGVDTAQAERRQPGRTWPPASADLAAALLAAP